METSAPTKGTEGCPVAHDDKAILAEASLTDPKILAHPNDFYRAMRHEQPVLYDEKLGM